MLTFGVLALGVTDVRRAADFWSAALGYTLREDGFGLEPEITAQVCRRRLRIYELPISYYGRGYADGKKITWRHGLEAVRVLFEQRLDGRNGRH